MNKDFWQGATFGVWVMGTLVWAALALFLFLSLPGCLEAESSPPVNVGLFEQDLKLTPEQAKLYKQTGFVCIDPYIFDQTVNFCGAQSCDCPGGWPTTTTMTLPK